MTTKTVTQSERTIAMVQSEANALAQLIERRNEWLNNPENKNSNRFDEVKRDTIDMTYRLQELNSEINELENN